MGAALGLGLRPGVPVLSLGTSGTAYLVSTTRSADPTGDVAGFADATGRFLPLACTLNCTLAVDQTAQWLGLERDARRSRAAAWSRCPTSTASERPTSPTRPRRSSACATHGSRAPSSWPRTKERSSGLLDALDTIDVSSSGIDRSAPLVLIGGGARGEIWREVVRRLSGRAVSIPEATEFVAIGAAVQAAAVLTGEDPEAVAERWHTDRGTLLEPEPRDDETIARLRSVRELALEALSIARPGR